MSLAKIFLSVAQVEASHDASGKMVAYLEAVTYKSSKAENVVW